MSNWERVNVAGVTHDGRQRIIRRKCRSGDAAELRREPDNAFDTNAVAVFVRGKQIGYLPADFSKSIAPDLDSGLMTFVADVYQVGSFETDDGREIWTVTLDIHWRHTKSGEKAASQKAQPALALHKTHDWLDEESRPAAEKPQPSIPPSQSARRKQISRAIVRGSRKAANLTMCALRAAALKVDKVLQGIAGADRTFLWILRFVVGVLLLGSAIALLLLSL